MPQITCHCFVKQTAANVYKFKNQFFTMFYLMLSLEYKVCSQCLENQFGVVGIHV